MWRAWACPFSNSPPPPSRGTRELMYAAARELESLPPITVYEPTYVERRPPEVDLPRALTITQEDDGTWIVEGPRLQRLMANVNFGDFESRNWFDRMLRQSGLFDRLEEMGIQDGDPLSSLFWNSHICVAPGPPAGGAAPPPPCGRRRGCCVFSRVPALFPSSPPFFFQEFACKGRAAASEMALRTKSCLGFL